MNIGCAQVVADPGDGRGYAGDGGRSGRMRLRVAASIGTGEYDERSAELR
ncbi:hypothetical protein [Spirillospora sp. NPDC048823]